jgi:hypothetical protein
MACIPAPTLPEPPSIFPLTLTPPTTPDPGFQAAWCCKQLAFEIPTPPIPLPPFTANAATAGIIKAAMATIQAYLDARSFDCPRE